MEADEAPGRNGKFQTGRPVGEGAHTLQFALALRKHADDGAGELLRHIHVSDFHRFEGSALLVLLQDHFRFAHGEFIAFAAHFLNQHG